MVSISTSVHTTRWSFIEPFVRGKDVLDIGPAELMGTDNQHKLESSLHVRVKSTARSVQGVEVNPEQVTKLQQLGYDITLGDAEHLDLGTDYDVVLAGELIEHLSNPGAFLDGAYRHLRKGGLLLLTTPNRFDITEMASAILRNRIPVYSKPIAKHVNYYDINCAVDLLNRHNYVHSATGYYVQHFDHSARWKRRLALKLVRRVRPQFLPGLMIAATPNDS